MKYRPTPLNIVSLLGIILCINCAVNPGPEGWGYLLIIYLLPCSLLGFIIDYLLQIRLKNYLYVFSGELFFILTIILGYYWSERCKTLMIPDNYKKQFIAIVYDVEKTPKLPKNSLSWTYKIKIPEDGVLLTSSKVDEDLPETEMETYSGIKFNTDSTELAWVRIEEDTFNCKGKVYHFQYWMVDSGFCCGYSGRETDSFKINLKKRFCRN